MLTQYPARIGVLALAATIAACAREPRSLPLAPTFDLTSGGFISGQVLGPAGNVCNSLRAGAGLTVVVIDLTSRSIAGSRAVFCPANSYAFFEGPGTYLVRAQLPADAAVLGGFVWRTITTTPVEVTAGDVVRDLLVPSGTPLGGAATLDGRPLEGLGMNVVYEAAPIFAATFLSSGPDGAWAEFIGRSPALLQPGVRYVVNAACADALGTSTITAPPGAGFLFPDEVSSVSCTLLTAPSVRFSHQRTRLVTTPMPGDIGGLSPEFADQYGTGWGVQFPVSPDTGPVHADVSLSQLYRGGLIVGIRPDRVLTGLAIDGYAQCEPACRDFGPGARLSFKTSAKQGTTVTWRYSDTASADGVGLKVTQRSYDGRSGDYVLFRFTFTNSRVAPVTFYAGMFADWDIDDDPFDDVGVTDLGGRLMYMTNAGGGTAAGSLIVSSAPVSGNTFLTNFGQTMATYVSALAGDFSIPSVATPGDHRLLHGVGPITLRRDRSADVWVAILAGSAVPELMGNAAAASADIARRSGDNDVDDGVQAGSVSAGAHTTRAGVPPTCKRGCRGQQ
jgi:hypothetical protein